MNIEETIDQAAQLLQTGKAAKAMQLMKKALQVNPENAHANHLYGLALFQERQLEPASHAVRKAIALDPSSPVFLNNLGLIMIAMGQAGKAIEAHSSAIDLDPRNPVSYFHRANVLRHEGTVADAIADYEKVLELDPYSVEAMNNLGSMLTREQGFARARQLFDDALAIRPDFVYAWNNLALLLQQTEELEQSEACLRRAIQIAPDYVEALVNLGNLLQKQNQYSQAAEIFQQVLRLNPRQPFMLGNLAYCRTMLCDWQQYKQTWSRIEEQIRRGGLPCSPIIFLNGSDDLALARKLATDYASYTVPALPVPAFAPRAAQKGKLRIGYFSTDFREHPVATLIVGVLEKHDRERFEIIGFALNREDSSAMRQRMKAACDEFFDISGMTDEQAVALAREAALDIAVDLNGYTEGCRPAIFKARICVSQISYLGFPGTTGSPFFDYTVADPTIIPLRMRTHYTESLLYLPDCFQPNDDARELSGQSHTRQTYGLPTEGVVFCCFNKLYKLNPEVFVSWMRILGAVSGSVLWLYTEDEVARSNLRREANKAGIDSERLVFAGRTPSYEDHLARYRLADLFLDTFPYTAHTTASDAMWAGLPVLTRSGQSFASRVGESLLQTLGLPELVTHSIVDYERKAIELAREPGGFDRLKGELEQARQTRSLYDTEQYTRWLEKGLVQIHARSVAGLPPADLLVERDPSPQ